MTKLYEFIVYFHPVHDRFRQQFVYVEAEDYSDARTKFYNVFNPNKYTFDNAVRINIRRVKEEKKMNENRYNTRVRHAISDELVEHRKIKHNLECRCEWIRNYLKESEDTITHKEYMSLTEELKHKEENIERFKIAIDIWDQARELCMNIADEMCEEK